MSAAFTAVMLNAVFDVELSRVRLEGRVNIGSSGLHLYNLLLRYQYANRCTLLIRIQ